MASENAACLGRVVAATARGVGAANIMSTFNLANSAENRTIARKLMLATAWRAVYRRRLLNMRRAGAFRPSPSRIADSIGELHLRACRAQAAQRTRLWTAIETGPPRRRRRREASGRPHGELAKNRTNDLTENWGGVGIVLSPGLQTPRGPVMPRYLFHLSDGKDTFIDDTGKDLGDSPAAHAHALRIIEKIRRLIPDADKSTWKIRIMSTSGQSMLTVISPGVEGLPQRPFGRRVASANYSQEPSL
jgi:hypothetical protein